MNFYNMVKMLLFRYMCVLEEYIQKCTLLSKKINYLPILNYSYTILFR